ncbi:MAG: sigma-70 family RNA polymerase sigma factor [Cyanobium sp.]
MHFIPPAGHAPSPSAPALHAAALPSRRAGSRRSVPGGPSQDGVTPAFSRSPGSGGRIDAGAADSNQAFLTALNASRDPSERLAIRNRLVQRNLPLAHAVTARMNLSSALPPDDLRQIASLGLLRAVEAFDPERGGSLSSFAVPYIRGAIQHELRDRAGLVRVPRALWELRRRVTVLQEKRRRQGKAQLAHPELAEALGCPLPQLMEALELGSVLEMRSLDAPLSSEGLHQGMGRTLLDQVVDPRSMEPDPSGGAPSLQASLIDGLVAGTTTAEAPPDAPSGTCSSPDSETSERNWLHQRLLSLPDLDRSLVLGHVCCGRSWADLGRELGLHPRQAQRRTLSVLERLQAEGRRLRELASRTASPPEAGS